MRFSIVVPVYNVEEYLPFCLDSINDQVFRDFEVVLVNDGSSDNSAEICRGFCKNSRLPSKLIEQNNQGLLAARRAGYSFAEGDYIISLDSDDALRRDALKVIDAAITETSADVVMYGFARDVDFTHGSIGCLKSGCVYEPDDFRYEFCLSNQMNPMCFKAVKREVIGVDWHFEDFGRLNMGEDGIQSALVFDRAKTVYSVPEFLYFYRPNDKSISAKVNIAQLDDMERVHAYLTGYAKKWDRGDCCCCKYSDAMTTRCVEELCHIVLHYLPSISMFESNEVFERVSELPCIDSCRNNPSLLSLMPLHSRLIAKLLMNRNCRLAWWLTKFASFATGMR